MGVDLLAAALAADPDAAPDVLRLVAHASTRGTLTHLLLLAHPNTPEDVLPVISGPVLGCGLHAALHHPAATDATRARVLDRTHREDVLRYVRERRDAHLAALRHLAQDTSGPDWLEHALTVITHPRTGVDAAVATLTRVLTSGDLGARALELGLDDKRDRLLIEAAHHTEHLAAWAARCTDRRTKAGLRELATFAAYDVDPYVALVSKFRYRLQSCDGAVLWPAAIAATGDAAIADEALDRYPHLLVTTAITSRRSLDGSRAAHRAYVLEVAGSPAPASERDAADPYTRDDDVIAIATVAPGWEGLAQSSHLLPGAAANTVSAAALSAVIDATARASVTPADTYEEMDRTFHLIRLLLHPATPASARALVCASLSGSDRRHPVLSALGAARATRDLPAAIAGIAMPALRAAADDDLTIRTLLHEHFRDTLRDRHDDARALLALEPEFAGTFTELLATVAALHG